MPKPPKNSGSETPFNPAALWAMMERTLGGLRQNKRRDEARAQDLVYGAVEASTWERRLWLARQALELDPENVDALLAAWKAHPAAEAWLPGQSISSRKSMDRMVPMDTPRSN